MMRVQWGYLGSETQLKSLGVHTHDQPGGTHEHVLGT
jgi:hypothetical protein